MKRLTIALAILAIAALSGGCSSYDPKKKDPYEQQKASKEMWKDMDEQGVTE